MGHALDKERKGNTDNLFTNNRLKEFQDIDAKVKNKQEGIKKEVFMKEKGNTNKGEEDNTSSTIDQHHKKPAKDMSSIFGNKPKAQPVPKPMKDPEEEEKEKESDDRRNEQNKKAFARIQTVEFDFDF